MALLDYPQNFLDEQGNPKLGVYGPSPASIGLLSAGLGMLSAPTYSRVPGDMSGIGQGAMQGLQAYQNRMNQIQQQRQAYNQSLMQAQNQEMAKQRFQAEVDERKRLVAQRERRVSQLPMLLEQIRNLPIKGIDQTVAAIRAQAEAGDVAGAYNAATGVIQQKLPNQDPIQTSKIPNTDQIMVQQGNEFKAVVPMSGARSTSTKESLIGPQAVEFIKKVYPNYAFPEGQEPIVKIDNGKLVDIKFLKTDQNFGEEQGKILSKLYSDWESIDDVKDLTKQVNNYKKLEAWVNEPSGPGDLAIIFGFMKSLDPSSIITDTEQRSAAEAGLNVPEKIFQYVKQVKTGSPLTPPQRKEFLQVAKQAILANKDALDPYIEGFIKRGKVFKFEPDIIKEAVIRNPLDRLKEPNEPTITPPVNTGPVDNDSADQIGSEAASLIFGQNNSEVANEPVQNPNFQYNDKGKITAVKVGENYDGAYKILQAVGVRPSKKNISRLYLANRALMKKDGTLPTASIGKFITIPPSLLRKQ